MERDLQQMVADWALRLAGLCTHKDRQKLGHLPAQH